MKITREEIRTWLEEARADGATHVVVRSDDFSHELLLTVAHESPNASN